MDNIYYPEVVQAVAGDNQQIYVYFSDGKITRYDVKPLIAKGGVFTQLSDSRFFSERLTVLNKTAAWDVSGCYDPSDCIDIDPFTLYDAEAVMDPLETAG